MSDDFTTMATYFSVSLLLGLAFGILVKIFGSSELFRWRFPKISDDSDQRTDEGDQHNLDHFRNFRPKDF
ncbi:hypothetical protein [Rhizobium lusitanum]|uniref:Uncharacterized protein n=1 Tax=Rhizobium lusitanum TaxID=293958 RepID=A0A1C3VRT3_9HYPH|nr:hypothetical protein [Rhizobium lusitanum]SCB30501.1 hypothetical protein GA0061101_106117 [Rhizobium lusitanum]